MFSLKKKKSVLVLSSKQKNKAVALELNTLDLIDRFCCGNLVF